MSDPNFPQYPQSQGVPGSGQQPYAPPEQYPGYPGQAAYPGHDLPPARPASGATAIIAGILAILGGIVHAIFFVVGLGDLDRAIDQGMATVQVFANIALAVILLLGGILLLMRKMAGRMIVIVGSALAALWFVGLGVYLGNVVSDAAETYADGEGAGVAVGITGVTVFIMCIPAVATFVLSVVPLTGRWIRQANPS